MWKFGIKYLKEIHKKQLAFNLTTWGSTDGQCVYDRNYCGTTACAAGHFALLPQFQAEGLWLRKGMKNTKIHSFEELARTKPTTNIMIWVDNDKDHNYDQLLALANFFGITELESDDCFTPSGYVNRNAATALDVANKMEEILHNYS